MPLVAKSTFEKSLLTVAPQLRKLLTELHVQTPADLARIDVLGLLHKQGIGRGTLRQLQALMRELGLTTPARQRVGVSPRLSVSFPAELSEAVRKAAALERSSPNDWVFRAVGATLERAKTEERSSERPRLAKAP